jgi:serine O-acetyltransferase
MTFGCLCEGGKLAEWMRADVARYSFAAYRDGRRPRLGISPIALLSHGLWATLGYRATHYSLYRLRPAAAGRLVGGLCYLWQRIVHLVTGIEIDAHAHIGRGLMIPHSGYIVIGPVRIGHHCNIAQGVTLGRSTVEDDPSAPATPVLADRVWVGPNAVVAGALLVGHDAVVGANSVVTRDVPPRGVMVGVPATLVSARGSFAQVAYPGMQADSDRARSKADAGAVGPKP